MELKNSYNTDNGKSKMASFEKLLNFNKENPSYIPIYAFINDRDEQGQDKILDNGIWYLSGRYLLNFLFGDQVENVILCISKEIKIQLKK